MRSPVPPFRAALVAAALVLAAPPLAAQTPAPPPGMVVAWSPQSVADALLAAGYRAELKSSTKGAPFIATALGGRNAIILFNACTDNANCLAIQFVSRVETESARTADLMNAWNDRSSLLLASLDGKGNVHISAAIILGREGIPMATFKSFIVAWEAQANRFTEFLKSS